MQCTNPVTIYTNPEKPQGMIVPCGRCLACRIKKRTEWAMRITHELDYYDYTSFVTLTYTDEYLPLSDKGYSTLRKKHLQDFIKRLRRDWPEPIKYFACGEYGDKTQRAHYHAILMGIGLLPEHRLHVMRCWPWCDWDNPTIRERSFGLAEQDSVRYVAQYIDKKLSGEALKDDYKLYGREPVFRLLSRGIGARYALTNATQLETRGYITMRSTPLSIPRYYINKTDIDIDNVKKHAEMTEIDHIETITGLRLTRDDLRWINPPLRRLVDTQDAIARKQSRDNLKSKTEISRLRKLK